MDCLRDLETFAKEPIGKETSSSAASTSNKSHRGKPKKREAAKACGKGRKYKATIIKAIRDKENLFSTQGTSPLGSRGKQRKQVNTKERGLQLVVLSNNRLTQRLKTGIYEQGKASSSIIRRNSFGVNEFQHTNDEIQRVLGIQQNQHHAVPPPMPQEYTVLPNNSKLICESASEEKRSPQDVCTNIAPVRMSPSAEHVTEAPTDRSHSPVADPGSFSLKCSLDSLLDGLPSLKVFGRDEYLKTLKDSLQRTLKLHNPEVYKDLTGIFQPVTTDFNAVTELTSTIAHPVHSGSDEHFMDTYLSHPPATSFELPNRDADRTEGSCYSSPQPAFDFLDAMDDDQEQDSNQFRRKRRCVLPSHLCIEQLPTPPKLSPRKMF